MEVTLNIEHWQVVELVRKDTFRSEESYDYAKNLMKDFEEKLRGKTAREVRRILEDENYTFYTLYNEDMEVRDIDIPMCDYDYMVEFVDNTVDAISMKVYRVLERDEL